MAKRSNGEGNVRQRPNGTWEARLVYTDPRTGAIRRTSFYGARASEVRAKMRAARQRVSEGAPVLDDKMSTADWLRHWISTTLVASSRRETTKELYERLARLHLEPAPFGAVTLDRLRPSHIEKLIVTLRAKELADSSIQRIFILLRVALDGAVRDGLIARNPAAVIAQPAIIRREATFLAPAQVVALLEQLEGSRYYAVLRIIATTGVRKGEALALKWIDIDLDANTLQVRGTLARVRGGLEVTQPKTAKSRRVLPLAPPEIEMLRLHRRTQLAERKHAGDLWREGGFVFTSETGRPLDPRNVLRALSTAARKAGIEHATVHTLRHSAATAWLEAGINIKAVSTLLGHADIRVTADVYGHVSDDVASAAMSALSHLLRVNQASVDPEQT